MKKLLCSILVFALVLSMNASVFARNDEKARLSDLSDEECIEFLKESGVQIPPIFEDEMTWAFFAYERIAEVEVDPDIVFMYGYSVMHKFANDIK